MFAMTAHYDLTKIRIVDKIYQLKFVRSILAYLVDTTF